MAKTYFFHLTRVLGFLALLLNIVAGYDYSIKDPTFDWVGFRLNIDYKFTGSIKDDEIVTYAVVSDEECDGGIISESEIESTLIEVSDSNVRISLLLNPENIHSARYVRHQENFAIVGVCSRVWIKRLASKSYEDDEIISAPRDDYIRIEADLEDLKGITDILDDNTVNWGVKTFRCDEDNNEIDSPETLKTGEKLRLCLKPTGQTQKDGIYIAKVRSFHFARGEKLQEAVTTFGYDEFTDIDCYRGADLCVIESVLSNEFFYSPGQVSAEGIVYLQYGYEEDRKRSLMTVPVSLGSSALTNNRRSLNFDYEKGEIVTEKTTDYMVDIEPIDKVYNAEAFRCDGNNDRVQRTVLEEGEPLKICVQPDNEAIEAGVMINSVESFSFGLANDDRMQNVVGRKGTAKNFDTTNIVCTTGLARCSVNATLEDWFFDQDGTMVVTGYVMLQFGGDGVRRLRANVVYRDLQSSSAFAGRSQVDAYFDTIGRAGAVKKEDPVKNWFEDTFDGVSDTNLTILYVVAIIVFILICLCCCAGCLFFLCYVRGGNKREEPRRNSLMPINIKIHDRNDDDPENSNSTDDRHSSVDRARDEDVDDIDDEYDPEYTPAPRRNSAETSTRRNSTSSRRNSGDTSRRNSTSSRRGSGDNSTRRNSTSSRRNSGDNSTRRNSTSSRRNSGDNSTRRNSTSSRRNSGDTSTRRNSTSSRRGSESSNRDPDTPRKMKKNQKIPEGEVLSEQL